MSVSESSVVIVGAGMSGMLAAAYIKTYYPDTQVTIIDQASHAGGLYRGVQAGDVGECDYAMRMLYETGYPAFDRVMHAVLPQDDWHIYPDNEKDIAGIYWQGGLQSWSPYVDLRRLPQQEYRTCQQQLQQALVQPAHDARNAMAYLESRFGTQIASYLARVLEKFYHQPAQALDVSATFQPAMNRVVLYDEDTLLSMMQDEQVRARIAWPDQMTLPVKRIPSQSALYPKRYGMTHVIDRLQEQLQAKGVRFLMGCSIASLGHEQGRITRIECSDGTCIQQPGLVIAASGLQQACRLLKVDISALPPPPASWMVFLRLANLPDMQQLYHFYCFDEGYATFRVTNYYSYCPDAYRDGYPVCVELWADEKNEAAAILRAVDELLRMQIIDDAEMVIASAAVAAHNLHALCTLEFTSAMAGLRKQVEDIMPDNLMITGPFAKEGVMLLYDVLRDMYHTLERHFPAA